MTAPLKTTAATIARQNHIPVPLFLALIGRESGWNPNARSPAGAIGLGQLMPATARGLGVNDPANPEENLAGAARYLAQQLAAFHTPALALAAYNAGPGAVHQYHGVPPFPETQAYVRNVLGDAQHLGGSAPPPVQRPVQPGAPAATPSPVGAPAPGAQQVLAAALLKASKSGQYGGFFNTLASLRQQPTQQAPTAPPTPTGPPHQTQPPAAPARPGLVSSNIAQIAAQQLGQPYVWGGESRKEGGFDCSGLVDWALRQQGYNGPRVTTYTLAQMGQSVKGKPLRPGDLVLANNNEHVVIYAGNGRVIAAPHTGTDVQYQLLSAFHISDIRRL